MYSVRRPSVGSLKFITIKIFVVVHNGLHYLDGLIFSALFVICLSEHALFSLYFFIYLLSHHQLLALCQSSSAGSSQPSIFNYVMTEEQHQPDRTLHFI